MEESSSHAAFSVKILSRLARWSAWLVLAVCLIFCLAWSALHFFIVPRITDWRPALERRASQALGISVKIGNIHADSALLAPTFTLTEVRLLDQQGRVALNLPRVLATVSPVSLWNLGFDRLYIERPQLDIRRNAEGRLFVAGLELSTGTEDDSQASDWIFSQTELVIQSGQLRWTDEMKRRPTLALEQVDLVMRNGLHQHDLQLDATPPTELGGRFSLKAGFRQPWSSRHAGQWALWEGQIQAAFDRVDIAHLQRYASLGLEATSGTGTLRAWVDVKDGKVESATADVSLTQVNMVLGEKHTPVIMDSMRGRLGGKLFEGGFELFTQDMKFEMQDGLHWPGGSFRVSYKDATGDVPAQGELTGDGLNLDALTQIAKRLPIDPKFQNALSEFAPKGMLDHLQARWLGPLEAVSRFDAKGRASQLEVRAASGFPGVRGLSLNFDLSQDGGKADVLINNGRIELPSWFEDPVIELALFAADLNWQIKGDQMAVQSSRLRLINADVQGEAQFKWHTSEHDSRSAKSRFPGVLDLEGSLSRAEVSRVHRYLPLLIDRQVRDYVRDAVSAGQPGSARFRLRGDLNDMPFEDPENGEFRIAVNLRNANFAYVPRSLQDKQDLPWPALSQLNGNLVFDRASLYLQGVSARLTAAPEVVISQGEAKIANLRHAPTVQVGLEMRGPLADLLKTVLNGSPLASMTEGVLATASANGYSQGQLRLSLPLDALEKSTVLGQLRLFGNELQITPDLPRLSGLSGVVHFSEKGFAVTGMQGKALGGDLHAEGGMIAVPGSGTRQEPMLRIQGTLSAEGLRQASYLGAISGLGQKAIGKTGYNGIINWNRGASEINFTSNLQGLALDLPPPFDKKAQTRLPFTLSTELTAETLKLQPGAKGPIKDQLTVSLGQAVAIRYVRDISSAQTRVLRGVIGIGLDAVKSPTLPEDGVLVQIQLNELDTDYWQNLMVPVPAAPSSPFNAIASPSGYEPTLFTLQAASVMAGSHKFNQVVAGGARVGQTWQANADAREFSGYVEYRQGSGHRSGRVYGRLSRLALAQTEAREVETLLDAQPVSIPALDIVVEDMTLLGKKLGRVEIEAINRGSARRDGGAREWRLNKLNVILPEATFTATGSWALINEAAPGSSSSSARRALSEKRRTSMNFVLTMNDAGELLTRMGMQEVFRHGKGKMEGQIAWIGSPLTLDYPSLSGSFNLNVETGQFLKVEPGLAKLLGVLNLQALPRRLTLDFRDVFSDGFAFDFIRGDVQIEQGLAKTNNLQMKGVNAAVLMEGRADISQETQDIKVVVVPEINAGTASLIASVINPAVGIGTFLAQLILRRPLIESTTQEFSITGSWADPKITKIEASAPAPTASQPAVAP